MATRDELYTALRNADAAGDNEGAQKLAAYIKTLPADAPAPTVAAEPPAPELTDQQKLHAGMDKYAGIAAGNTIGGAEDLAHVVTGALSSIPAGLAGLGTAGVNTATDLLGTKRLLPSAGDIVQNVGSKLTYQPQTQYGQEGSALAHKALDVPAKWGDAAGQKVLQVTGSPEAATLVSTGIQAAPMLLDPAARSVARAVAAPSALERASGQAPAAPTPAVEPVPRPTPITREMTPEEAHEAAVQTLLAHDVPLSTGQRGTGFGARQAASAGRAAETVLGPDELTDQQGQAFTSAVLRRVGVDARRATPDTMQELQGNTNRTYNTILGRTPTRVDPQLIQDLSDTREGILNELGPESSEGAPLLRQIDNIIGKTDSTVRQAAQDAADRSVTTAQNLKDAQAKAAQVASDSKAAAATADRAATQAQAARTAANRATANESPEAATRLQDARDAEAQATAAKSAAQRLSDRADSESQNAQRVQAIHEQTLQAAQAPAGAVPGTIEGRAAQNSRAALGRLQQSPTPSVKHWAGVLKDNLDDAFERSATPEDAAAMTQVRQNVQKTKQFEGAIDGQGIISPRKLYQNLTRKNERGQFIYGAGDQSLVDLAKAGQQILPDKVGNSGTATRGADVAKIMAILRKPVHAVAEGTAAAAGRLNSVNAGRGTAAAVRAANTVRQLQDQIGNNGPSPGAGGLAIAAAPAGAALAPDAPVSPHFMQQESPEQQRLRLQAQALRNQ